MASQFDSLITSPNTHVCVIAAPGSGKTTHLLIPKTQALLADPTIRPEEVLLLTFSRLSAQDLKRKISGLDRAPRASTVHSWALAFLLSENNHEIRDRIESILLDFEKDALLSDLKLIFPARHKTQSLKPDLKRFSAGWATDPHSTFEQTDEERAFKHALINWLLEHKAAMMEEILYFAVDLARHVPESRLLSEPQYILVDEYQDLNELEQRFIDALSAKSRLVLVVGDPDQSIYSFKYAHPRGISDFSIRAGVHSLTSLETWRCPTSVVYYANQLLKQIDPSRTDLLKARPRALKGTVEFIKRPTQTDEFYYVLKSVADRIAADGSPREIIVLVPRRTLGIDFVAYANANKASVGIPDGNEFCFSLKPDFSDAEQERILRLALLANPGSLLHTRAYLGLGDKTHYASELRSLKEQHGSLERVINIAGSSEVPNKPRIRKLAARIEALRDFQVAHEHITNVTVLIDELFPANIPEFIAVREMLLSLVEEGDTVSDLYSKFIDYIRTIPHKDTQIQVMTVMASKGLEADHVYMLGCNAGNIPGSNRSEHLTDLEHRHEQLRFMYVGFTRAKQSLAVCWSRYLSFAQSKAQHTPGVGTIRRGGKPTNEVGVCEFLQNLDGVVWK